MTTSLIHLSLSADGSSLRTSTLSGISYIICPVISKVGDRVEWPANAATPELIPADVLTFATESRNNRPVVMGHPKRNGEYVSANKYPELLEQYCFGHVFNAAYSEESKTVSCEIWLDPARAIIVDSRLGGSNAQRVIERLKNGEMVEVSEGNFVVTERTSGVYDGKEYGAIWRLCIGDHLAVLNENQKGACSIEDGCGALRGSSSGKVVVPSPWSYPSSPINPLSPSHSLSVSILSQARRPTFSGTETSSWSAPSFSEYVRYLHEGREGTGPTSVSQCDSSLKRLIASHSLLGDPDASNLSDLTFFPCVNPSNGKLNEKALRAIVGSRGSQADIDERAKVSAQDMARRLLNSEFGAELSTSTSSTSSLEDIIDEVSEVNDMDKKKESFFRRLISSMAGVMRSSMSNNDLRQRLYKALSSIVRGLSHVYDEDVEAKTVKYCIFIKYGDSYLSDDFEYRFYQRTFSIDSNGNVTVNDDPIEIELYEDGWRPVTTEPPTEESIVVSGTSRTEANESETCTCHNHKGDNTMDRKAMISRICASSAIWRKNEKALEAMDDNALLAISSGVPLQWDEGEEKGTEAEKEKENVQLTPPTSPVSTPLVTANQITLTRDEYTSIKAAATAYQEQQRLEKESLITSLSTAQSEFSVDDLNGMTTPQLEKLAKVAGVGAPVKDYSGRGVSGVPSISSGKEKVRPLPDTWGLNVSATKTN